MADMRMEVDSAMGKEEGVTVEETRGQGGKGIQERVGSS